MPPSNAAPDGPISGSPPALPAASAPELPDHEEVDWGPDLVDPRPSGSGIPMARTRVPHPLAFIHVDGAESYGPHGHGLQNVAERDAILAVLTHCAGTWAKQGLTVLVICMYAEQHAVLKKDIASLSTALRRQENDPASARSYNRSRCARWTPPRGTKPT